MKDGMAYKNGKQVFLLIVFLAIGLLAYANGDPVAKFSSINRVANPEPLSISEINIVHEQINITHVDGYNCFDVTYTFKNDSDKDFPEIHYGFPIDYLVADEQEAYQFTSDYISESIVEVGWNEKLIKDIVFTFNDEVLPFHSSKESVRDAGFIVETYDDYSDSIPVDPVNRRWFYTKFAIKPHAKATLNVRYKVYANSYVGLYEDGYKFSFFERKAEGSNDVETNLPFSYRYFPSKFDILYDFTPAKHFGNGKPYVIDINIDLTDLANPCIRGNDGYDYYVNHIERNIYVFNAEDIEPINLTVNFQSDHSGSNVSRIIERFKIPESKFDVEMKTDTVWIDFHSPVFVSDVVCEMETAGVKSIRSCVTYADGTEKRYRYESKNMNGFSSDDTRIKSPVILTVTDLYHDGYILTEDRYILQNAGFEDYKFRIKNIRLTFDASTIGQSVCNGIKVLDARFINNNK